MNPFFFKLKLMSWKLMLECTYENVDKWVISTISFSGLHNLSVSPMPAQTNQNTNVCSLILLNT